METLLASYGVRVETVSQVRLDRVVALRADGEPGRTEATRWTRTVMR